MRSASRSRSVVSTWFDFLTEPQRALALQLQRLILEAAPQALEAVRWGQLVFSVDDEALMALVPYKTSVNLQFFNGAGLPGDIAVLEGVGKGSRHLRCRLNQPVDAQAVVSLVQASVRLGRQPVEPADPLGR